MKDRYNYSSDGAPAAAPSSLLHASSHLPALRARALVSLRFLNLKFLFFCSEEDISVLSLCGHMEQLPTW